MAPNKERLKNARMIQPALPSPSLIPSTRNKSHKLAASVTSVASVPVSESSDSKEQQSQILLPQASEKDALSACDTQPERATGDAADTTTVDVPPTQARTMTEVSELSSIQESPLATPRPVSVSPQEIHPGAAELPTEPIAVEASAHLPVEIDGHAASMTVEIGPQFSPGSDGEGERAKAPGPAQGTLVGESGGHPYPVQEPIEEPFGVAAGGGYHPTESTRPQPSTPPVSATPRNGAFSLTHPPNDTSVSSTPGHSDESFQPRLPLRPFRRQESSPGFANTNGYHNSSGASDTSVSFPGPKATTNPVDLHQFLLGLSSTKEMADWFLQINNPSGPPFTTYAHGTLLWRSLRLRQLSARQHRPSGYGNMLNLFPARSIIPHAFETALRFLYTDQVLSTEILFPSHLQNQSEARLHALEYILSYWISGIELGLEPVAGRAEKLLAEYLAWETIELAYKNAMDLLASPISTAGKYMTGTDYLVAAQAIIRLVLSFLVDHIDNSVFKLDVNAASVLLTPRLPSLEANRTAYNPALASISFGSMPSCTDLSPSSSFAMPVTTQLDGYDVIASKILLNADFENLLFFNTMLRARDMVGSDRILSEVVNEREARRIKLLHAKHIGNKTRMENASAWNIVGVHEWIEEGVVRCARGSFLLPSKGQA